MGNFGVKDNLCKVGMDDWLKGKLNGIIEVRTLLWTNPNPSATSFDGQIVDTVSMVGYKSYEVFLYGGSPGVLKIPNKGLETIQYINSGTVMYYRKILINNTSITFSNAMQLESPSSINNGLLIPSKVYGIKEVDLTV